MSVILSDPESLCACGHTVSQHRPRVQYQNDQPVVVGRDECLALVKVAPSRLIGPWVGPCRCRSAR